MNSSDSDTARALRARIRQMTTAPGVYRMYDADGELLYVGKARNLRRRVASYFLRRSEDPRIAAMVAQVARVEVTVTGSEDEALLLEASLIKRESPRYNIMYRDDKSYPYLCVSGDHPFPRIHFYRGQRKPPHEYFGPYPNARAVRQTIVSLQKLFRLRPCTDAEFANRSRPCLQHQIGRCSAPCVGLIDEAGYAADLDAARELLRGQGERLIARFGAQMEQASAQLEFERAAMLRDRIAALRRLQDARVVDGRAGDLDVIAVHSAPGAPSCVVQLAVRAGAVQGHRSHFPKAPPGSAPGELVAAFVAQHYTEHPAPPQLVVSDEPPERDWLERVLAARAGRRVRITASPRGVRRRLLEQAQQTAAEAAAAQQAASGTMQRRLAELARALDLAAAPQRIECFDISHTGGELPVASCVVFDADGPCKSAWRRYHIEGITPGDDYAAIAQAVERRFRRVAAGEGTRPDLLLIDGGQGQLAAACAVLARLGLDGFPVVGVAKGPERRPGMEQLHLPDGRVLRLPPESPALHLIQQIRDEAHRFAITGHRGRRARARKVSRLEDVPGLGPARRRALLRHFGGLAQLRRADLRELASVPGIGPALAERIHAALHE